LEIRFWEDKWLGKTTLQEQHPVLYNIIRDKSDTLEKVMETSPTSMTFRRDLIGPWLASWNELLQRLASVKLIQGSDEFRCRLTKNGAFLVSSMYKALIKPFNQYLIINLFGR
jgi:hypothetical protein